MYIKNDFNHRIIVSKSEFIIYTRRIKNELEYKNFVSEIKKSIMMPLIVVVPFILKIFKDHRMMVNLPKQRVFPS